MTYSIMVDKDVPVDMRDGKLLRADIYRPDDRGKHPAILTRTPYHRQMSFDMSFLPYYDAVMAGYAIIIENQRGTYNSEGQSGLGDIALTAEGADGYDTVEWIAAQPWCDGNVGTCGGSYIGQLLMGPWLHLGPTAGGETGALGFGFSASRLGSQLGEYNLAFFNKYLRGIDVSLPIVRYFVMGKNIWRTAETWPLPETQWQRFFLHSRGRANSAAGDGLLSRDEPGAELFDAYTYNPHFPVPTTGYRGGFHLVRFAPSPQEQSPVECREDVLCYTTQELKKDTEVTGPLKLHLFAATSAKDTDFTAKLIDVYPDGRAYNVVSDGIVRARFRKSLFKPEFVIPGEINEYVINLEVVSQVFRKGHHIRIDVSSSSFPEYDRNMNTGNDVGKDAVGMPALQRIYHQAHYASYIDLPIIETLN